MTGIMPYPKRQKNASGGGFKGKTPLASKIRHFSRQKPLFIRLKRVFAVSHFAHSDCLILLARQQNKCKSNNLLTYKTLRLCASALKTKICQKLLIGLAVTFRTCV
jgi:hypothetical protein